MAAVATQTAPGNKPYLPIALANNVGFHTKFNDPAQVSEDEGNTAIRFVPNKEIFGNLRIYLEQVQKFPDNAARFENLYPPIVFKEYTEKRSTGLYDEMKRTVLEVRGRCSKFQTETLPAMNNLSGDIATFADRNVKHIQRIRDAMVTVTDPSKKFSDPDVKKAIIVVKEGCIQLVSGTKTATAGCQALQTQFADLKKETTTDKQNLERVNLESTQAWPKRDEVAAQLVKDSDAALAKLEPMYQEQLNYSQNKDGSQYYTNSIGAKLYYRNPIQLELLKKLDREFQSAWSDRLAEYKATVDFQASYATLTNSIQSVLNSIDAAIAALKDLEFKT